MNAEWVSAHEAAKILGVHYRTIIRQIRLGKIPAKQVGRIWRIRRFVIDSTARRVQ